MHAVLILLAYTLIFAAVFAAVYAACSRFDADLRDAADRERQNARLREVLGTADDTRNFLGRY